jgi:uncharacterized protein YneR
MKSARHIKLSSENLNINFHTCTICSKKYETRMGLWLHNQKCKQTPVIPVTNDISSPDIVNSIMENFKKLQEQIALLSPSNITNNNNNNNIVNIHLTYLNTHCNNALNIDQFVESVNFGKEDYNEISKNRYIAQGVTEVLKKKFANLSVEEYPIHCSTAERNQPTNFYVRDNDQWTRESHDNVEYNLKYGDFDESEEEKPKMMRFIEKFNNDFYDKYIELSKKDPNLKRIDDRMSISGQSITHIEMLRKITEILSLYLDTPSATNTDTEPKLVR